MSGTLVKVLVGVAAVGVVGAVGFTVAKKRLEKHCEECEAEVRDELKEDAVQQAMYDTDCAAEEVTEEQIEAYVEDNLEDAILMRGQEMLADDIKKVMNHPVVKIGSFVLTFGPLAYKLFTKAKAKNEVHIAEGRVIQHALENAMEVEEVHLADGSTQYVTDDGIVVTEF